jgi:NADPH-dependent 2,4-dienoyl-CoA reductase/sulfur reductase-like enzyme
VALARQLQSIDDGGVFVLTIPPAAYRCPPGPYERACQVAWYLKTHKPRSKLIGLDANQNIISKPALFRDAWKMYPNLEYRASSKVTKIDPSVREVTTDFGDRIRYDVVNVIPPQRAGDIARKAGLITHNNRWCDVDWRTMESKAVKGIHVLGDATLSATGMPKSGHMANQHGKVCAAALIELLNGRAPNPAPVMNNTCYSFVSDREAIHAASSHRYDARRRTMIADTNVVSPARSELEAKNGWNWARNIWADSFS